MSFLNSVWAVIKDKLVWLWQAFWSKLVHLDTAINHFLADIASWRKKIDVAFIAILGFAVFSGDHVVLIVVAVLNGIYFVARLFYYDSNNGLTYPSSALNDPLTKINSTPTVSTNFPKPIGQ